MQSTTPAAPGPDAMATGRNIPTEPLPIARVNTGMAVVDATGEGVGTVTAVQLPGTDVRPDVPAGVAEHLMTTGYLRIDGTGLLATDVYVGGGSVAEVAEGEPGVVTLTLIREDLHRAG